MSSTAPEPIGCPPPHGAAAGPASSTASPSRAPGRDCDHDHSHGHGHGHDHGHGHGHGHDAGFNATTVGWGVVVGVASAILPLATWWVEAASVHALAIALIAGVYVGFAVADGRTHVIAVECVVAASFAILATAAITLTPWLLVAGYAGHGCKDLWQHRTHFVNGTRWWPPFCAAVDWSVAAIIAVAILAGAGFR